MVFSPGAIQLIELIRGFLVPSIRRRDEPFTSRVRILVCFRILKDQATEHELRVYMTLLRGSLVPTASKYVVFGNVVAKTIHFRQQDL